MISVERYSGGGSLDNPEFPLRYVHSCGAVTICHNEEDLLHAREAEIEMETKGFIFCMILLSVVGAAGLSTWGIIGMVTEMLQ